MPCKAWILRVSLDVPAQTDSHSRVKEPALCEPFRAGGACAENPVLYSIPGIPMRGKRGFSWFGEQTVRIPLP